MKLHIDIERNGTPGQLTTRPADLAAWEQWSNRLVRDWATEPPTMTDVMFLAYRADTNGQQPRPDFQAWLDGAGLQLEAATLRSDAVDPTQKAAGAG